MLKNFGTLVNSAAVTNQPKQIVMLNQRFVLINSQAQVVVLKDQCPHRGAALFGWLEGDCIRCPYHGWKFKRMGDALTSCQCT